MRPLAAILWGLSAVLITIMVLQDPYAAGSPPSVLWLAGASLVPAVLIGVGGRPGLVGAVLGAGLSLLALLDMMFVANGCLFGACTDGAWLWVAYTGILTIVSGLAAREIWRLRAPQ